MRMMILTCLFVRALLSAAQTDPGTMTVNAIVTLRVGSLSGSVWTKVAARISKEDQVDVEYSCIATGIIVMRLQHVAASEKADIMAVVKRLLHEGGVKGNIEFLDVHVFPEGADRCSIEGGHQVWSIRPYTMGRSHHRSSSVLEWSTWPDPISGPGRVRIRCEGFGVDHADGMAVEGPCREAMLSCSGTSGTTHARAPLYRWA